MIPDSLLRHCESDYIYGAQELCQKGVHALQWSLLCPEIQLIVDKADSFDLKKRHIITQSGKHYPYDFLVFATGCVPWLENTEGLVLAGDQFYQHQAARRLLYKLATIEKGRISISVSFSETPNVSYQCGIAPIETTLMLDDYRRWL